MRERSSAGHKHNVGVIHGQTGGAAEGVYIGIADSGLSDNGNG